MVGGEECEGRRQADARLALFVVVAFVWLWLCVDPSRTYYGAGLTALPAFSPDVMFRRAYFTTLGGPVRFVSAWLSQFFLWPAWGAAILTALAAAAAVVTDRLVTCLAGRRLHGYRYAPALLFLLLDGHYLHLVDWQLGWVVALAATDVVLRRPEGRPAVRLALLLAEVALLYGLLRGPAVVAVPLLALGETRRRETRFLAAVLVLWLASLPWLGTWCGFDQPLGEVYRVLFGPLLPNDEYGMARAAVAGMAAFALLLGALALMAAPSAKPRLELRPLLAWAGVAAGCAALVVAGGDRVEGRRLEMCAHAERGEWDAVLATAHRMGARDITQYEDYNILLALTHTGQSGDWLFRYGLPLFSMLRGDPRLGDEETILKMRTQHGLQLCELDLELGFINMAEHETHESLETQGTYPGLLVPMARIEVLQSRPRAAKVFLRLAAAQPGDPEGAAPLLRALRDDPALSGDDEQTGLARNRLHTDMYNDYSTTHMLEQAVKEHPDHRLAYEYLMAWYLLSNQTDKLVAAIPTLPAFGREALPRHYEEAVLCQEALTGAHADLGPWRIRSETRRRFEAFTHALGCAGDELAAALRVPSRPPLWAARVWRGPWSDTYYYYRLFGTSGVQP
jgi:hypothetical protein